MQVLVRVTGEFDPLELWPYVTASPTLGSSRLLTLDVHDSRELVSVLVALADRGITILQVRSQEVSVFGYELVIGGLLSSDSIAGLPESSWTKEGDTTVLRAVMSQDDLTRVLEALESLGVGLISLQQVGTPDA
jgi:hypothetical protein